MASDVIETGLFLDGLRCAGCVNRVERDLRAAPGVIDAMLNYTNHRALVRFDPGCTSVETLRDHVVVETHGLTIAVGKTRPPEVPLHEVDCQPVHTKRQLVGAVGEQNVVAVGVVDPNAAVFGGIGLKAEDQVTACGDHERPVDLRGIRYRDLYGQRQR